MRAPQQIFVAVREAVKEAVERYNMYRSPEATAELLEVRGDAVIIKFSGPRLVTCGTTDYVEDFIYELVNISGLEAAIESVEFDEEGSITAKFTISRKG